QTSLTYKMPTTRSSTLKQAEEKIVSLSESEGSKGKKKAYEDPTLGKEDEKQEDTPEYLLEKEDETYADYVTTKDLSLFHLSMEVKLQEQRVAAERAAEERQLALEGKLQALMKL